ncbi:enolase C-terminal domain-like protein [Chitinophaga flava]|uniref:Mandelate racemase/muconate lactonizing enzyme C-terminal domain-containing protein n=1 Tax=Chitinophaga flava TaxID=2259036 RepID=A0A365XUU3_9BACT|nr:enolase C-terminal domain-like protein [Chitinophaga flava]RBL90103.1 hypothetical protein DF182_26915 [Chitinophaga flava]
MQRIGGEFFNIKCAQISVLKQAKAVTPFEDATMGPFQGLGIAVLSLEDQDGFIGEAPIYSAYNNILETCLLPILLHSGGIPYADLYNRMYWSIRNEGFRGPASALLGQIDLALHDIAAQRSKMPLHRYLGANRNEVKIYGSGGGANYTLKELEKEVGYFLDAGVDCYKMKIGRVHGSRMMEDVERVKFVRNLLGKNARLAVDANQVWTCDEALLFLDKVESADISWLEEPVHSASLDQIGKLCSLTTVPVSYGESERSALVFPALVNAGVRHLQPVATQIGSVQELMSVRDLASRENIEFSSGGYPWYTAALVATAHEQCQVEYLYSLMYGIQDYFKVQPVLKNGNLILSEIPGFPVKVDWEYCNKKNLVLRSFKWESERLDKYMPIVSV